MGGSVHWTIDSIQNSYSLYSGPDIDSEEGDANGDGGDGGDGRGGRRRPPGMKKSAQMVAGEGVLGRVVRAVGGVSFSFK